MRCELLYPQPISGVVPPRYPSKVGGMSYLLLQLRSLDESEPPCLVAKADVLHVAAFRRFS